MKESQRFLVVAFCSVIFFLGLYFLIGVVFQRKTLQLLHRLRGIKVIKVNTAVLDRITDEDLINSLFAISDQAFKNAIHDNKLTDEVKLTCYSLFKQIKQGDADENHRTKHETPTNKYNIWLQQAGKTKFQCQKEYITLIGQNEPHFNETVKAVGRGELRQIMQKQLKEV